MKKPCCVSVAFFNLQRANQPWMVIFWQFVVNVYLFQSIHLAPFIYFNFIFIL